MAINYAIGLYEEFIAKTLKINSTHIHLTGSRFFQTAKHNSDYDFFIEVEQLPDNYNRMLLEKGFISALNKSYSLKDKLLKHLYAHQNLPIHLQIVTDANKKLAKQNKLLEWGQLHKFSKQSHVDLWNLA